SGRECDLLREAVRHDVRKNPAGPVVGELGLRIQPADDSELSFGPVLRPGDDLDRTPRSEGGSLGKAKGERFPTCETELLPSFARTEGEGQNAHLDQVHAVDPLVALCDHRSDPEQARTFRGPIARAPLSVAPSREND